MHYMSFRFSELKSQGNMDGEMIAKKSTTVFPNLRAKISKKKKSSQMNSIIEWRADECKFTIKQKRRGGGDGSDAKKEEVEISVAEYYKQTYDIELQYPHLPVINTGYRGYFPVEFLFQAQEKVFGDNDNDKVNAVSYEAIHGNSIIRCLHISNCLCQSFRLLLEI